MGKSISVVDLITNAKIIFWDFDGVIKDSAQVKTNSFCKLFESYGNEIVEKIRNHNDLNGGMSRYDKFPIYLSWVGEVATEKKINELSNQFSSLVMDAVVNSEWIPGVEEYLRNNKNNQSFILVSATPVEELNIILKKIELEFNFDYVFGTPTSKISGILTILEKSKLRPEETVMIGDSIADKNAADTCKVPFILKKNNINSKLFNYFSGYSLNDFTEI